jgi:hypothetical protein
VVLQRATSVLDAQDRVNLHRAPTTSTVTPSGQTASPFYSSLILAALMIGHHFSTSVFSMLDVHPTTDDRTLILSRYPELNADQKLLVKNLNLDLPSQPPPRIEASGKLARPETTPRPRRPTLGPRALKS